MSRQPANTDSVKAVHEYLRAEIRRAQEQLTSDQWEAIMVGMSDQGVIISSPCRLVLPFHYHASIEELNHRGPPHFNFPKSPWKHCRQDIPEFAEQYQVVSALEDGAERFS